MRTLSSFGFNFNLRHYAAVMKCLKERAKPMKRFQMLERIVCNIGGERGKAVQVDIRLTPC